MTVATTSLGQPLHLPRRVLYGMALRDYGVAIRKALVGLAGKAERRQELVESVYERHWDLGNQAYVESRDHRRDLFRFNGNLIHADGWFIIRTYVELFTKLIEQLGVSSVLEVGAGRGKNLALLALKRPGLHLTGLELTRQGVRQSLDLVAGPPARFLEVAGVPRLDDEHRQALARVDFRQGSALQMPFADQSFDFAFTCLVLEQLPDQFPQALCEMRRVTRKYCAFIEAFREANGLLGRAYLRGMNYFRASHREFRRHGLQPIAFTTSMPQKLRFRTGLLVCRII